ncbi:MAG: Hydroxymethylpyrimidine/phosphomethylpyrimidine kinase [Betaproteobacteria bacterium ADurb.Bin341]|nr:MAG: Hydroxymethylpyrimidine/phosphomethylpyrimidine kinase [Betaproteobacteria bacterium ADurb.Bin341]
MRQTPPAVLVFAASDPTGGAGIQADLLTLASLGCQPLTALTALTVQDTCGIQRVQAIETDLLEQQARSLLADIPIAAFKLGALGSVDNILCIARIVSDYPGLPLILDPVLASGRGDALADEEMIKVLREALIPRATVLTPNLPEARRLAGPGEEGKMEIAFCARHLLDLGARYVLVTGTHDDTPKVANTLYGASGILRRDHWQRLPGSYHGSGCTLASALAAYLARGTPVEEAVFRAQEYTWNALSHAFRPGKGQFIPDRLFRNHPRAE